MYVFYLSISTTHISYLYPCLISPIYVSVSRLHLPSYLYLYLYLHAYRTCIYAYTYTYIYNYVSIRTYSQQKADSTSDSPKTLALHIFAGRSGSVSGAHQEERSSNSTRWFDWIYPHIYFPNSSLIHQIVIHEIYVGSVRTSRESKKRKSVATGSSPKMCRDNSSLPDLPPLLPTISAPDDFRLELDGPDSQKMITLRVQVCWACFRPFVPQM